MAYRHVSYRIEALILFNIKFCSLYLIVHCYHLLVNKDYQYLVHVQLLHVTNWDKNIFDRQLLSSSLESTYHEASRGFSA